MQTNNLQYHISICLDTGSSSLKPSRDEPSFSPWFWNADEVEGCQVSTEKCPHTILWWFIVPIHLELIDQLILPLISHVELPFPFLTMAFGRQHNNKRIELLRSVLFDSCSKFRSHMGPSSGSLIIYITELS
jgi:hypothetical protein